MSNLREQIEFVVDMANCNEACDPKYLEDGVADCCRCATDRILAILKAGIKLKQILVQPDDFMFNTGSLRQLEADQKTFDEALR